MLSQAVGRNENGNELSEWQFDKYVLKTVQLSVLFDSAILRILPQGNNQKCVQRSTYTNFRYSNSVS